MQRQFFDLLEEKSNEEGFSDLPEPIEDPKEDMEALKQFLKSKKIPVEGITDFNVWLRNIKNCY